MEQIRGLDAYLTRIPDLPDCVCPGDDCCDCLQEGGCVCREPEITDHRDECPIHIACLKRRFSSLCLCKELAEAERIAESEEIKLDHQEEKGK